MAVGAPSRALMRRIKAPMAVLLCIAPWAASRNIPAARFLVFLDLELSTLPPLMRLSGHTLSQEQKCFSLFQQFMSKPVSEMMTSGIKLQCFIGLNCRSHCFALCTTSAQNDQTHVSCRNKNPQEFWGTS